MPPGGILSVATHAHHDSIRVEDDSFVTCSNAADTMAASNSLPRPWRCNPRPRPYRQIPTFKTRAAPIQPSPTPTILLQSPPYGRSAASKFLTQYQNLHQNSPRGRSTTPKLLNSEPSLTIPKPPAAPQEEQLGTTPPKTPAAPKFLTRHQNFHRNLLGERLAAPMLLKSEPHHRILQAHANSAFKKPSENKLLSANSQLFPYLLNLIRVNYLLMCIAQLLACNYTSKTLIFSPCLIDHSEASCGTTGRATLHNAPTNFGPNTKIPTTTRLEGV